MANDRRIAQDSYLATSDTVVNQFLRGNRRGELVVTDFITQLVADGRVFTGGSGPEVGGIDSAAALDDTTPTFAIKAPAADTTVLILAASISMTAEGGAAGQADFVFDSTSRSLSGTTLTEIHNHNGSSTRTNLAQAVHTGTAGAGTGATVKHVEFADNQISVVGPLGPGLDVLEVSYVPIVPIALAAGGQFYIYTYTGTSDSKWIPNITWAEIPTADFN
jgi:hypothetical protein